MLRCSVDCSDSVMPACLFLCFDVHQSLTKNFHFQLVDETWMAKLCGETPSARKSSFCVKYSFRFSWRTVNIEHELFQREIFHRKDGHSNNNLK